MALLCETCKMLCRLPAAQERLFPSISPAFCSEICLMSHIRSRKPLSAVELRMRGIRQALPGPAGDVYSPILCRVFRSEFEKSFAEYAAEWPENVFYEPHALRLHARGAYIPDFFIPDYGVWLELKGEWRFGGKAKFMAACNILGADRVLLVPPAYAPWFKRREAA